MILALYSLATWLAQPLLRRKLRRRGVAEPGYLRAVDADLYVRQFHDMKGGVDVELLDDAPFLTYVSACAITLARAHGQSPNIAAVVGYIGKNDEVARAVTDWSLAYADVSEQDYRDFLNAVEPLPLNHRLRRGARRRASSSTRP